MKQRMVSGPLAVIVAFLSVTETALATVAAVTSGVVQLLLASFAGAFAVGVASVFFVILWRKNYVLFSPAEYTDTEDFEAFAKAMHRPTVWKGLTVSTEMAEAVATALKAFVAKYPNRLAAPSELEDTATEAQMLATGSALVTDELETMLVLRIVVMAPGRRGTYSDQASLYRQDTVLAELLLQIVHDWLQESNEPVFWRLHIRRENECVIAGIGYDALVDLEHDDSWLRRTFKQLGVLSGDTMMISLASPSWPDLRWRENPRCTL